MGVQVGTWHIVGAQEWLSLSFLFVLLIHLLTSFNTVHRTFCNFFFFRSISDSWERSKLILSHIHLSVVWYSMV